MVERKDSGHHAKRFTQGVIQRPVGGGYGLALDLEHQTGEILQLGGCDLGIEDHRLDRIAAVSRVDQGQVNRVGADADKIVALAGTLLDGRVGRNRDNFAVHAPVDCRVIGGDIDFGFLANADEPNVLGRHKRLDHQRVVTRDHFDDGLAGANAAADG